MSDEAPKQPAVTLVVDSGAASMALIAALNGQALPPDTRVLDEIAAPPSVTGPHGKAWEIDLKALRARYPNPDDSTVVGWVIEARWAHPVWHSYVLFVIDLRPRPGAPPAHINLPGATHEFFLYALNPEEGSREKLIQGLLDRDGGVGFLSPANFAAQFISPDDATAKARVLESVQAICAGRLSPDTDHLSTWSAIWGEAGIKPEFRT